ncbi:hypothetical protein FXO38_06152 [Capsicum annuum]|uniref:Ubiquitin-like protease family profile domain-containing protein n=1 Tax=Capsicum annuum TaxID=4072 RepID=A0A2G2YR48_CAPAN|nr:hypothetical protein FXO38_06152 [Capsicum annuum]PHT72222.1 hypothetical protein T459_23007 [Capsicum annuum]
MMDNTPTKMVTRSISRSDPDAYIVPTFDLGISQSEEEDALPSEEVRGIGHKRKVRDDVPTPDNDDDDLVKEVVYRNITSTSREIAILQFPCLDIVEDTTLDDVSFSDDFQDALPATGKNKGKKNFYTASSPPHKKQKQVKSVPSSSNIPSRSSLRNKTSPLISVSKASKRSLSPVAKHQTKKVVTQKTIPQRTLPKQPSILEKRKSIVKPPVKPKPSNVPTDVPSSSKSDEESILAKQFAIFRNRVPNKSDTSTVELRRGDDVEAGKDIPVVSQPLSQHIGTDRSSTPKQGDTYSVELQQILEENLHQMHTSDEQVIEDDGVATLGPETESQYEISDELLPSLNLHINVIFYYLHKRGKYSPLSNYSHTTVDCVFKIKVAELWKKYVDPQSCTSSVREEYAVCEYMNGYRLMTGVPWHTVDHVLIPLHVKERLHWVLLVVSFLDQCLYIYDSYNSAIHDVDCGIYVATYAEFLTGGQGVSNKEFDIALLCTRYAALLWDYDPKKKESGAMSDDEEPAKIHRPLTDWDSRKDVTIL